jgi:hypothetical protein
MYHSYDSIFEEFPTQTFGQMKRHMVEEEGKFG